MKRFEGEFRPPLFDLTRHVLPIAGKGYCQIDRDEIIFSGHGLGFNFKRIIPPLIMLAVSMGIAGLAYLLDRDFNEFVMASWAVVLLLGTSYRHKANPAKDVHFKVSTQGLGQAEETDPGILRVDLPGVVSKGALYFRTDEDNQEFLTALADFRSDATHHASAALSR
ncbi:MAG: hypothetical protein KAI47_06115 [Deltaproteobacteria bacterium]|nr:hypothetical protein [Deltaproteobacteria bacterium]